MPRHAAALSVAALVALCSLGSTSGTALAQRRPVAASAEAHVYGKAPGRIATWRAQRTYQKLLRSQKPLRGGGTRGEEARSIDATLQGDRGKFRAARSERRLQRNLAVVNFGNAAANAVIAAVAPASAPIAAGLGLAASALGVHATKAAIQAGRAERSELRLLRVAPVRAMKRWGVVEEGSKEERIFKQAGWLP